MRNDSDRVTQSEYEDLDFHCALTLNSFAILSWMCVFCVLYAPFQCVTISTATASFVAWKRKKKNAASTNASPKNFHILMDLKLDKRAGIVKEKSGLNIIQKKPMVTMTVTMMSVTMKKSR